MISIFMPRKSLDARLVQSRLKAVARQGEERTGQHRKGNDAPGFLVSSEPWNKFFEICVQIKKEVSICLLQLLKRLKGC